MYKKISQCTLSSFCDADYVGDRLKRKSTYGNCQFLGKNLISWSSKRQSTISLSTTKSKYILVSLCNTQMPWVKNRQEDNLIYESNIHILCDNTTDICLSKNPILHSRAKHIEVKHHFIIGYV